MRLNLGHSLAQRQLDLIYLQPTQTLLDVGCGSGTLAILAKLRYPDSNIIGLDPDPKELSLANSAARLEDIKVEFIKGVAEALPFDAAAIDAVASTLTFHHLTSPSKKMQAIREVYRVLKPGGTFYLADAGKPTSVLERLFVKTAAFLEPGTYFQDHLQGKLPVYLKDAGFTVTESRHPHFGISFWQAVKPSVRM